VLSTPDVEGAKAFYGAVFGWDVLDVGGAPMWALPGYGDFLEERTPGMRKNMAEMGAPERFEDVVASILPIADGPAYWGVTFAVDDADATAALAAELGGSVVSGPVDAPWVRMAEITDPQGAAFTASQFKPENKDLVPSAEGASAGA
jgi:predicted enzyme related to lactoylglutathione lyase